MNVAARLVSRVQLSYYAIGLLLGAGIAAGAFLVLGVAAIDVGVSFVVRAAIVMLVLIYLVIARCSRGLPVPQAERQVPSWFTEGGAAGYLFFGAEMGTGMRTFSPTILPHVVALSIFLMPSVMSAAGAATGFALGRLVAVPIYRLGSDRESGRFRFPLPMPVEVAGALTMALCVALFVRPVT